MDRRAKIVSATKTLNNQRHTAGLGRVKGRWISCAKGDILMAGLYPRHAGERPPAYDYIDIDENTPMEEVRVKALMTPCECHPNLTMNQLMDMMYDRKD